MRQVRVLMVDDEADDRLLFGRMLRHAADWEVDFREALNGTDAEALIRIGTDLDVILLDLKLPGRSGIELLEDWSVTFPQLPAVIVLTGHGSDRAESEALEVGAFEYLSNHNCTPDELALAVRYAAHVTQLRHEMLRVNEQRIRAEAEMREAQSASGELDGVHRAVATILHEINSPLTGIMNYQRLLLEENPPQDMREIYQEVLDASRQIAQVMHRIEDLQELHARPGMGRLGPLDLCRRSA
jgi:DNA-binding NtrC family response regulator